MNSKINIRILCSIVGIFFSMIAMAQGTILDGQVAYGNLFRQSVKSCDEFMCRFNEEEFFPNLDTCDTQLGKKNFLLLFDHKLSEGKEKDSFLKDVFQFYDAVKANNVKLKYDSKNWYAELRINFAYKKNNIELGLVLQPEKTPKNLPCWTIVGINGLETIGYTDSIGRLVISPEQHEAEFMEIESDFKFYSTAFSKFRGYKVQLDALSYFFALVESGTLTFERRISTRFHFFDIPSYTFSVKYHKRKKSNTGWLIFDYKKASEKEKTELLNQLLGR